ncbi:MAG: molybdopterin converting factor subunit 1 [Betaproteobacteria bacterium]|nr:molybdopterin converting factor subunit 1 [Betaproteobacteria bacterium]NBP09843.1 molybdopterin converting factor subunit 1 [Betaproteobacteria bacterium]NBP61096.1 molybdopterin converting factor subunit 1 [Betaproteobacteria bacterium]NBQ08970.1 molybdopterin converting factor subunit 1 [Betaproteobacteria bacterium]NBS20486.1 molybdopterin converting factor subunit 1 [Betaproteobacteria bacterium]
MRIQLRFFAALREALDTETEALDLPPEVTDIGKLRCFLASRGGAWSKSFAHDQALRAAINQRLVQPSAALHDGAEVAFFPPVTGG